MSDSLHHFGLGVETSAIASSTGGGGPSARPYDPVRDKDNKK